MPGRHVVRDAIARLNDMLDEPPRDRTQCLLLFGPADLDRSGVVRSFVADNERVRGSGLGGILLPVVCMRMPEVPTERSFYRQLLRGLGRTAHDGERLRPIRVECRTLLHAGEIRMLIVEDMDRLHSASRRHRKVLLNTLRFLANDGPMSLVGVGSEKTRAVLLADEQLADRFELMDLSGAALE